MKLLLTSKELFNQLPTLDYEEKLVCNNNAILITGAAGFLGIHLLKNIVLSKKYNKVYAIVREKEKVKRQAIYYQLGEDWINEVCFIQGDLLNIENKEFPEVEYIIHSAAQIHCIKTLKQLWKNNVETTDKIAKIYQHNKVFFISTLSVFVSSNKIGVHKSNPLEISDEYLLYGGYAQSKYIGEKIMEKYHHRIIRLGLITGASDKGIFPQDFFVNFIKMNKELGVYPDGFEDALVDMTPVDDCVELIMNILENEHIQIYHIANKEPTKLSTIIELLELKKVSKEQWFEKIKTRNSLEQYLLKYAFFKKESVKSHFEYYNLDLFQTTGHSYHIQKNFKQKNKNMLKLYCEKILRRNNDL